jgi:Asp-tRNA(Asn)/Glu-tRNA(Gln) amidotransferase C subunit
MYDFMPHTRSLLVTGGGAGKEVGWELEKMGIESSDYQGPTTITSLVSQQASSMGIETMSLIVHLPQYAQLDEDYIGTVRLMEVLSSLYNLTVDEAYIGKAKQQLEQISLAVDRNPQLKATVEQLEHHYEARARRRKEEETPRLSPEVERFLTEMEKRFKEG